MKIIVIGAGLSGLATAALLAKDNHEVLVLEKNEQVGGRASIMKKKGFTFDLGPSWYLMPDVFERFFKLFGKDVSHVLKLKRLTHNYRVFYADKSQLDVPPDAKKVAQLFEELEPGAGGKFLDYIKESETKYKLATEKLLYKNYNTFFEFLDPQFLTALPKLGLFETMHSHIGRRFKNEKIHQVLQYTLVFLGGSPKNMLSPFSMLSHVDFNQGVYYPKVGIHGIATAIEKLALQHGAEIKLGEPVTQIVTKNRSVKTVQTSSQEYKADIVISTADYVHSESLIDNPDLKQYSQRYWDSKTFEPSLFLMYLGYKGKISTFKHHNLLFSDNWMQHFDEVYKQPQWPTSPSLYICNPNKTDPSLAPKGHENLFVLVPVSQKIKDTPAKRKEFSKRVLEQIRKTTSVDLTSNLVVQETFSINDFVSRYNSYMGHAMGLPHTFLQTALFRPKNISTKINNLFFAGATTVPGIGMPMCLISAELVKQHVDTYTRNYP